jgi:hypothetical protein
MSKTNGKTCERFALSALYLRPQTAELYGTCGNEMDPPLCGSTAMSHNEFKIREPIEPQEASPMKPAMNVLGIDIAKRMFHAVGMDDTRKVV